MRWPRSPKTIAMLAKEKSFSSQEGDNMGCENSTRFFPFGNEGMEGQMRSFELHLGARSNRACSGEVAGWKWH